MPLEAIKIAVPYIQALLKAMHIPIIEVKGFEADDLIGTKPNKLKRKLQSLYGNPDKDFATGI
jgi:DNA polymerase-1